MNKIKLGILAAIGLLSMATTANAADTYNYASVCPSPAGGAMQVDAWSFYKCECTSYVADKLNERGIPFKNTYRQPSGYRWSNASNWSTAATRAGIPQDSTPRVGDVAWFSYGHVAYVQSVSGSYVTISEYNYNPRYDYRTRTILKTSVSKFIHF